MLFLAAVIAASICLYALLTLMAVLLKTRSRRLTPKERVAQLKRRRPIARKAHLKTCSNSTKQYREVPRWKLERWAREKRATQIDERGLPIWPAERAFHALLCQILPPSAIRIQEPFYTPQTFILRDFFVPSAKVVFEIDGSTHGGQIGYDAECDAWLASQGIRTSRLSNATVLRNPHAAMTILKAELGL
jgi:very-short-patch-repair endonuclease